MSLLYGFPNKLIANIGTLLMLDPIFNKFMYYSNSNEENIFDLPELDNPIELLKNKKVFYSGRINKVLHNADISLYITLHDYRPHTPRFNKSQNIKTTKIEIGVICHNDCRETLHGLRDVAVATRIVDVICENEEISGLGKIELDSIRSAYNMPVPEYSGFQIIVSAESFGKM